MVNVIKLINSNPACSFPPAFIRMPSSGRRPDLCVLGVEMRLPTRFPLKGSFKGDMGPCKDLYSDILGVLGGSWGLATT